MNYVPASLKLYKQVYARLSDAQQARARKLSDSTVLTQADYLNFLAAGGD